MFCAESWGCGCCLQLPFVSTTVDVCSVVCEMLLLQPFKIKYYLRSRTRRGLVDTGVKQRQNYELLTPKQSVNRTTAWQQQVFSDVSSIGQKQRNVLLVLWHDSLWNLSPQDPETVMFSSCAHVTRVHKSSLSLHLLPDCMQAAAAGVVWNGWLEFFHPLLHPLLWTDDDVVYDSVSSGLWGERVPEQVFRRTFLLTN